MQLMYIESSDPLSEDHMLTAAVKQYQLCKLEERQDYRFFGRILSRGGADVDGVSIDPPP
jgi:hypothetical protein